MFQSALDVRCFSVQLKVKMCRFVQQRAHYPFWRDPAPVLGFLNFVSQLIKHQPIWLYVTTQHEAKRMVKLENLTIILNNNNCEITLSKGIANLSLCKRLKNSNCIRGCLIRLDVGIIFYFSVLYLWLQLFNEI